MAAQRARDQDQGHGTRVLPLRRDEAKTPSPVLVREALDASGIPRAAIRAAVAVTAAVGEAGVGSVVAGDDDRALSVELARRTGLTTAEVGGGLAVLRAAGLLRGEALDPDLLCSLPVLSGLALERCRREIEDTGGRMAPALAVLRTIARVSGAGGSDGGDWVLIAIQDIAEETMYGRTAVTQALADLEAARLLVRAEQPPRRGLKIRISAWALGADQAGPGGASVASRRRKGAPLAGASPEKRGVTVEVGGARVVVPPGSQLQLSPGVDYRLEIGSDGAVTIRVDD